MHLGTEHGTPLGAAAKKEYRPSKTGRLWDVLGALFGVSRKPIGISLCTFLFTFVNWFGIPSPCAAAYLLAQETPGTLSLFPLLGLAASLLLRLIWGVPLDIWQYIGCLALLAICLTRRPRTPTGMVMLAGFSMMPRAIAAVIGGASLNVLLSCAAVPLCMGLALALKRGLTLLREARPMLTLADKASALLLVLCVLSGAGYLRIGSVNLGQCLGVVCVLICGYALGDMAGAAGGLLYGLTFALCGQDGRLTIHLALGGFCAGLVSGHKKRWLSGLCYLAGHLLAFYLTPIPSPVFPHLTAIIGCVLFLFTGERIVERLRTLGLNSAPANRGMEGLFVQQRLLRWESAMRSMAAALPSIPPSQYEPPTAQALANILCVDCPDRELCWSRNQQHTEMILTELMGITLAHDDPLERLSTLQDCHCIRLSAIPSAVAQLSKNRQAQLSAKAKARFEREMTFTHLDAMADIISEIRALTCGETLGDLQAAYQINKAIRDLRFPAKLCYARQVDGHLQAAIETDALLPLGNRTEKLLRYLERDTGLSLGVTHTVKNRVELEELPLYSVEVGVATLCAGQQTVWEEETVSGDGIAAKQCQGGRFLLMLSDGMGHGGDAHQASNKTLELLLLCMEAGYTRRQAIAAVNGMMLSATAEERFATVDLFDLSLWTGEVQSEKLGACASWLVRGNYLKQVDGSSLPLGILEDVQPTSQNFRMHSGDILIVISDGVADVLPDAEQMERAILDSLYIQPQRMADALLRCALLQSGGTPRDDMTILTLLMVDRHRSQPMSMEIAQEM